MLVEGAIYRFNRTDELRYYRAARTKAGMDFLYPIQVNGTRLAGTHKMGGAMCCSIYGREHNQQTFWVISSRLPLYTVP